MGEPLGLVQQQDAKELAKHYTWKKRLLETCSVLVFVVLYGFALARARSLDLGSHALLLGGAFFAGMVAADLVSGLVHWLADTWGTVEVPILGPTLIKNFREHHADPKALTRKGLIETNGDNCMIVLPAPIWSLFVPVDDARPEWLFVYAFSLSLTFWIMLTNQIHKWAHLEWDELSAPVRFLMRTRLILSVAEHKIHHTIPYESHYCITTGWLNAPLARIGFFRWMEWAAWRVTGAIPRENDIGTAAAVKLAIQQRILPPTFDPQREIVGTRNTPVA
jgi:ubiquitin-conjugating enzyme E2 variant